MIKGKSPYPFQTIALAVSFSPGLPFLVSEMEKLCKRHMATAVFIHMGKKTGEKQKELSLLLNEHSFNDGNSRIYWEQGDVINDILRICKHEVVDLIIMGASERNNFHSPAGKTASGVSAQAKCSVLIYSSFTSVDDVMHIVVEGGDHPKTELTIQTAIYFCEKVKAQSIRLVDKGEVTSYTDSYLDFSNKMSASESPTLTFSTDPSIVSVDRFSLLESNCSDITEYCFKNNADILFTRSNDHLLRIFDRIAEENSIEHFLQNMPCHLLVVHSRNTE